MKAKNYILALLSSITLFLNFRSIYFNGFKSIFSDKFFFIRLVFLILCFLILYFLYNKKQTQKNKYLNFLCALFTIFITIGSSYRLFGTIKALYIPRMLIWTMVRLIGFYKMILYILTIIAEVINYYLNKKDLSETKTVKFFNKHPFWYSIIILICSWSIYYVAFYPMILSPDPSYQIKQFLGERTKYSDYSIQIDKNVNITNHHPVFHTVLLGSSLKLGRMLGSDNFGLFIYTFFQGLFLAITFAQTINFLKKKEIKNRYLFLMLAVYAFVPMFPLYALNGNKDVYYTLFIIWLLMLIFDLIDNPKEVRLSFKKSLLWFFDLIFICLFRNNGIYLVILLFPCILLFSKVNIKKFITIFLLVIALFFSYEKVLLPSLKITGESIREVFSIFFQQTSRYVINHEEELTENDKEIINKIIDYNKIKTTYNPVLSDSIKNTYNKYATKDDLKNYFRVWFKGFYNHPMTYIDATLNNNYGYFDPGDTNWYIYAKFDSRITMNNLTTYHYNNLEYLRIILQSYGAAFLYFPVIGLISNIGFSNYIIIAYGIWLIKRKDYKYLLTLIPLYISVLVCMVSPANTYFRYAMPYVFSIPFIVGTWFLINKKELSK